MRAQPCRAKRCLPCSALRTGCSQDAGEASPASGSPVPFPASISIETFHLHGHSEVELHTCSFSAQLKKDLPFDFFSYAYRFRSGFKIAFRWCPCIKATEKDKLRLTSPSLYQSTRRKSQKSSFNTETHFNEEEKTSFTPTQQTL